MMDSLFWGGSFNLLFAFHYVIIFLIAGIILFTLIRGISQWNKNNHSPRLSVSAVVKAKRTDVRRHHHGGGSGPGHNSTSTTYYVTFEVESGDRMELCVNGSQYGMLAEGDRGTLSFQGTRYLGFERK